MFEIPLCNNYNQGDFYLNSTVDTFRVEVLTKNLWTPLNFDYNNNINMYQLNKIMKLLVFFQHHKCLIHTRADYLDELRRYSFRFEGCCIFNTIEWIPEELRAVRREAWLVQIFWFPWWLERFPRTWFTNIAYSSIEIWIKNVFRKW